MDSEFSEIEAAAKQLKKEWDSPGLWPRIESSLAQQSRPCRSWIWPVVAAAAAMVLLIGGVTFWPANKPPALAGQPLLTQQALTELEKAEAAYTQSIDRLAKLVEPQLTAAGSPLMAGYREKLALLDAALVELRVEATANPYHPGLHMQLASLYRDKQSTLQEVLAHVGHSR